MDIRLLAMDLDGTSLQEDHLSFTPRLRQALLEAHQQGVIIVPNTGRQHNFLPPAVKTGSPWENLCVLCNGGEIRRIATGELLKSHYIPSDLAAEVVKLAQKYDVAVELSIQGHLHMSRDSRQKEEKLRHMLAFHLDHILPTYGVIVDNLSHTLASPETHIEKINLVLPTDFSDQALTADLSRLPLSPCHSGPFTIEVTHQEATKGNGLLDVCTLLDIDPAQAMAIGDNGNDVSMLQAAGFSVAMGNAEPHIQAAAKAVTLPFDQDGAALAVERYILHK